jgi:uncharacterized protein
MNPPRLAILLWATAPDQPHLCATPFSHAAAAAAMDAEVEMYFTAKSVHLLEAGVADAVFPGPGRERSVYEYMRHAAALGVKFFACSQALAAHGAANKALIPEVCGYAGAATFAARCLDPAWRTLTY